MCAAVLFSFCLLIHYYIPMFGVSTNTDRLLGLCSHVVAFASASLARRRVLRASRTRSGCTSAREGVQMIEMSQVKWRIPLLRLNESRVQFARVLYLTAEEFCFVLFFLGED